jgi:hypothetical protein
VYGDVDPEFTYVAAGWKNNDDENLFNGSLIRASGENAGKYNILQGFLSVGRNYTILFTWGVEFTITPSPQTREFNPPASLSLTSGSYPLVATVTTPGEAPELPVRFRLSATDEGKATLSGNVLTPLQPGVITVTAYVNLDNNYLDAAEVSRQIFLRSGGAGLPELNVSALWVFPNPVRAGELFRLSGVEGLAGEWIRVYNVSGALVLQKTVQGESLELQLANSGIYFIRVKNRTVKLIVK